MLAIRGKNFGVEKALKMIEDMVDPLKTEQQQDVDKKEDCEMQLDTAGLKENEWAIIARLARRSPLPVQTPARC